MRRPRVILGGARVDLLGLAEAVGVIASRAADASAPPLAVCSINLDHIHHFGSTGKWEHSLDAETPQRHSGPGDGVEWLNLVDGAPLASEARRLTGERWPRLAGSDLIGPLLDTASAMGLRVGVLGGSAESQTLLTEALARDRPDLTVAGLWSPEREALTDPVASSALAASVARARVDLLIVGLGKPRQELWIAEYGDLTGAHVLLAFGAVVDFLGGRVRRAPRWIGDHGLEWAWRLVIEPRRLARRYLVDGPPAYRVLRSASRMDEPSPARVLDPLPSLSPGDGRFAGPEETADVAVVVVTYNSADDIASLLSSLRAEALGARLRVVVVDNGSTDGTLAILDEHRDLIRVPAGGNRGYAGGINAASAYCGRSHAVLILNPDLVVEPGAVAALYGRMTRSGAGLVVPLVLDEAGEIYHSLRREPTLTRALSEAVVGSRFPGRPASSSEIDRARESYLYPHLVEWATGAAVMIRSDVAARVGAWDERYFLYAEEIDYFRRARDAGFQVWFEPGARVRHRQGGSGASADLVALLAVNRVRYADVYQSRGRAELIRASILLGELLRGRDRGHRAAARALLRRGRWVSLPHATAPGGE